MCQSTDLPLETVSTLLAFGQAIVAHVRAHRDGSLDEHERGVLEVWRGIEPQVLQTVVMASTRALDGRSRPVRAVCPRFQERRPVQSRRTRQLHTPLGPISVIPP